MVIQRWQSLLLLIAVALMCIFCATPFAVVPGADSSVPEALYVSHMPVLLILNIVTAVLLFIDIFMYGNLKRQIAVALICMILELCTIVVSSVIVYHIMPEAEFLWAGGVLLPLAALVCTFTARRLMRKDLNTLRSYDRMR